jgi:branched-chain amino acid transport system ATP-binding protein
MLTVSGLETGYGKKQVTFGVSMEVHVGEVVAIIGPNGAGKSTVLKAVHGLIPVWQGEVRFTGSIINGCRPAGNVSRGIAFVPQGNRVFGQLTVMENLDVVGSELSRKELRSRIDEMFGIFPILKERRRQQSGLLSGGEQQILAFARALVLRPKLLMLDEPSLGLSPNLVSIVLEKVRQINQESGVTVLIVEQKVREVLRIANRVYGMRLGKIAVEGGPDAILVGDTLKHLFLN